MKKTTQGILLSGNSMATLTGDIGGKTKDVAIETSSSSSQKFVSWGENNDMPSLIAQELGRNAILYRAYEFNQRVHAGEGLSYYKVVVKGGKRYIEFFEDSEIDEWFGENDVNGWLWNALTSDYEATGNIFPELVMNLGRNKIARLFRQDPFMCRWGKQDASKRDVTQLFVHAEFEKFKEQDATVLDVLNSKMPLEDLLSRKSGFNFVLRVRPVSLGRYYYETSGPEVLINSGTLQISRDIKTTMKSLLKNQATMLWHIEISDEYMEFRYGKNNWLKLSNDKTKREKAFKEIKDEIDKYLAGAENAGKTLLTGCYYRNGNKQSGVVITPLKNQLEKGAWLPDLQQMISDIYQGMGVDPSSVGGFGNQNRTMNSGSEKKNSFSITESTFSADQAITTSPFMFVAKYNGWLKRIPNLRFGVVKSPEEMMSNETPS